MRQLKATVLIGILLIIIGGGAIAIEQVSYTRHEKFIDIGPFEATVEKEAHCFRLPLIFGLLVIASGIALITLEIKKSK